MKFEDNLQEYYKQRAAEYEQIYYREVPERRHEIDCEVERLKKLATEKIILDTPCGTGYWTQFLSQVASEIVAADISREMINVAQRKIFSMPVDFIQADLYNLPFKDGCFDLIALGFWFSHHPKQDYESLFTNLKKLVKPSGKIWMIDNNTPAEQSVNDNVGKDEHGNNYKKRYLDNGRKFIILKNYFMENELKSIFTNHFQVESLNHKKYYWSVVLNR